MAFPREKKKRQALQRCPRLSGELGGGEERGSVGVLPFAPIEARAAKKRGERKKKGGGEGAAH